MVKCVFCGKEEHSFIGIHIIGNDGNVNYYCSSKCRKNALKLKRDKRKLKWTAAYREEAKKAVVKEAKRVSDEASKKAEKKE
jgi:large subunit ribosomal protein L24e